MKNARRVSLFVLSLVMVLGTLVMLPAAKAKAVNPYMPLWEHVPDGEPRIFEDPDNPGKKRVYVYGSHDTKQANYCGRDVRAWSAPVEDLSDWRDEGPVFQYQINGKWDEIFAPDITEVVKKTAQKNITCIRTAPTGEQNSDGVQRRKSGGPLYADQCESGGADTAQQPSGV